MAIKDTAAPPFATSGGTPVAASSQPKTGGRDFTLEHRTQSAEAVDEKNIDDAQTPKGGAHLCADAGAVTGSGKLGGVDKLGSTPSPFKNLK